jgi:hypothetical protein
MDERRAIMYAATMVSLIGLALYYVGLWIITHQ